MKKNTEFEQEFKRIIDFSNNNSSLDRISVLKNELYNGFSELIENESFDFIDILLETFANQDKIEFLRNIFLEFENAPIDFNYAELNNCIREYAKCKNMSIHVKTLENFDDLISIINDMYIKCKNSFSSYHPEKEVLIKSILFVIKENERRIKEIIEMKPEEKRTLEDYYVRFINHEVIEKSLINSILNLFSKKRLLSSSNFSQLFTTYTNVHNEIVVIDGYDIVLVNNTNYSEQIIWQEDSNLEEFVESYFKRLYVCKEDLFKYMLPQNNFPKYDEFLNLIIQKFREQLSFNPNLIRKYNMLEDIRKNKVDI